MAGQDNSKCNGDTNMEKNSEPIDENNEENIREGIFFINIYYIFTNFNLSK